MSVVAAMSVAAMNGIRFEVIGRSHVPVEKQGLSLRLIRQKAWWGTLLPYTTTDEQFVERITFGTAFLLKQESKETA